MIQGRRIAWVLLALVLAPSAALAAEYKVDMTKVNDPTLGAALQSSSTLIELEEKPPEDVTALRRRAQEDVTRLQKALRSSGYYDGKVLIKVDGEPVAEQMLPGDYEDATQKKVPVDIKIEPGPLYKLRKIEVTGFDLKPRLKEGTAARAAMIIGERRLLLDRVMAEGHPFATVELKPAVVDHAAHTLDVTFEITPGPVANLGRVDVHGLDYTNPDFIAKRAVFPPDTKFSPAKLEALRGDLQSLDLFSAVKVTPGTALDADGTLPVRVDVTERERHFVGFGASYSTNDGAGATAYWGTRNLFGNGERLRFDGTVSGLGDDGFGLDKTDYELSGNFRKPDVFTRRQDFIASLVVSDEHDPDTFDKKGATANFGFERALTDHTKVTYGWEIEASRIKDDTGTNDFFLNGPTGSIAYDTSDDLLNPTKGVRLSLGGEALPKWLGSSEDVYTVTTAAAGYLNLAGKGDLVLAGRLGVASAFGSSLEDLPADRRLYAGGGGSVRGYEFRSISPENADGDEIGGRSAVTGSVELRYRFMEDFGIVPFFDAGTVSPDSTPNFDEPIQYAVGLGFRYYTGFGPIRADIAVPLNPRKDDDPVAFYVSIGQAF